MAACDVHPQLLMSTHAMIRRNHSFPFDPAYGYTLEALLGIVPPEPPADFAEFWRDTHADTRRVAPDVTRRAIPSPNPALDLFEIDFTGLGGFRVGGWLTIPKGLPIRRGMIISHGYGGREAADASVGEPPAAMLYVCARGFNRSARPNLPNVSVAHVLHGIEHRDTYLHRFCVADLWAGISALQDIVPTVERVDYIGCSFGGGIGALALPWEDCFTRAYLDVPSFGHHPLRVTMECNGSGEAVRRRYLKKPQILDVLRYFDAATAARFIRIPMFVSPARFDPAVPPPGQFAIYNAIPGPKRLFARETGHFEYENAEAEEKRLQQELAAWFRSDTAALA